jgi:hypothetical protein
MKQHKLYAGTLAVALVALAISGFAHHGTLPCLLIGAGLLVVMLLPAAAARWNPLARRISPQCALLVVSTFISVLLAEAVLQVFYSNCFPRTSGGYSTAFDSTLGWFPVPNYYSPSEGAGMANNSMGFRGREFHRTGKVGIMILGDSFVWGWGIAASEDRFTDKIQARHPEWNIYGAGVTGYGTDQELLLLQRIFDQLKPRIVFLNFCTENDHQDNSANMSYGNYKPYFTTNAAGVQLQGIPVPCSERAYCAAHPLLSRSYLFQLGVRVWKKFTVPPLVVHDDPTPALLLEMREYLQAKGACFIVGFTAPDPEIERLLQRSGIPSLVFKPDDRYGADLHWTTQGHSLAAERIEQFLLTNSVVSHLLP